MSLFKRPPDESVESPVVPDSATPVYGFRLWTINRVMATLHGTYGPWTTGRNKARCGPGLSGTWGQLVVTTTSITSTTTATQPPPHDAPGAACRCGFNALDTWEQLELKAGHYGEPQVVTYGSTSTTYPQWIEGNVEDILYPQVPGVAKGWGRVMIHAGGWRSQYAEIVALIDLCAVLPWFDRDEPYHKLLEYSAKHYGVPIIERIPDLGEFA